MSFKDRKRHFHQVFFNCFLANLCTSYFTSMRFVIYHEVLKGWIYILDLLILDGSFLVPNLWLIKYYHDETVADITKKIVPFLLQIFLSILWCPCRTTRKIQLLPIFLPMKNHIYNLFQFVDRENRYSLVLEDIQSEKLYVIGVLMIGHISSFNLAISAPKSDFWSSNYVHQ